jgi:hypothetical protein
MRGKPCSRCTRCKRRTVTLIRAGTAEPPVCSRWRSDGVVLGPATGCSRLGSRRRGRARILATSIPIASLMLALFSELRQQQAPLASTPYTPPRKRLATQQHPGQGRRRWLTSPVPANSWRNNDEPTRSAAQQARPTRWPSNARQRRHAERSIRSTCHPGRCSDNLRVVAGRRRQIWPI